MRAGDAPGDEELGERVQARDRVSREELVSDVTIVVPAESAGVEEGRDTDLDRHLVVPCDRY